MQNINRIYIILTSCTWHVQAGLPGVRLSLNTDDWSWTRSQVMYSKSLRDDVGVNVIMLELSLMLKRRHDCIWSSRDPNLSCCRGDRGCQLVHYCSVSLYQQSFTVHMALYILLHMLHGRQLVKLVGPILIWVHHTLFIRPWMVQLTVSSGSSNCHVTAGVLWWCSTMAFVVSFVLFPKWQNTVLSLKNSLWVIGC